MRISTANERSVSRKPKGGECLLDSEFQERIVPRLRRGLVWGLAGMVVGPRLKMEPLRRILAGQSALENASAETLRSVLKSFSRRPRNRDRSRLGDLRRIFSPHRQRSRI